MLKDNIPLYKKVIDDLKSQIDKGEYKKGDLLPSENDLCLTYSTTRATIRQSLASLTNLGYIIRKHGKGSIVCEPKAGLGILSLRGVTAGVGDKNLRTSILQNPIKQKWPLNFYYELNADTLKAGCVFFTRLRYINQIPVLYEETHIANINIPRFSTHNLEDRSLFQLLNEKYNIEVTEGEQKIWAVNGNKTISKLLNIKTSEPLVHMKRKLQTNVKGLQIYSSLYCNTAEYFLQDYF